jgi:hypothetical protein
MKNAVMSQEGLDLKEAFWKDRLIVKVGDWSITNPEALKCFWGGIGKAKLSFRRVSPVIVGYALPCRCNLISCSNQLAAWVECIGPHICPFCGQVFIVKFASQRDREWLEIFGEDE